MDEITTNARTFAAIVTAYILGLTRVKEARVGQLSLELALMKYRTQRNPPTARAPEEWKDILRELHEITVEEHESFKYVGTFGHLVFATTMLDSFLLDTARFIFLLIPASIGKSQGITVNEIASAKSLDELLIAAVEKRARELSYKSFLERIEFLEKQYGIPINLEAKVLSELEHFSGIRNVMIHDHAFYNLKKDADGQIILDVHSSPLSPMPVDGAQISQAIAAYLAVVSRIAMGVFEHLLKVEIPPITADLLRAAQKSGGYLPGPN